MKEHISRQVVEQILHLRAEFKQLPFDFHSCFYYDPAAKEFRLHRKFLQQDDEMYVSEHSTGVKPFINFKVSPELRYTTVETPHFVLSSGVPVLRRELPDPPVLSIEALLADKGAQPEGPGQPLEGAPSGGHHQELRASCSP